MRPDSTPQTLRVQRSKPQIPPAPPSSSTMPKRKQQDTSHIFTFDEEEHHSRGVVANVDRLSGRGCDVLREEYPFFVPPSPERPREKTRHAKSVVEEDFDIYFGGGSSASACALEPEVNEDDLTEFGRGRENKYFAEAESDAFLREWMDHIDVFIAELLRHDGLRGDEFGSCKFCSAQGSSSRQAEFRCQDCVGGRLMCAACCVERHLEDPFHNIMKWNGRFFEKTTLQSLGLVIQLGHPPGTLCRNPRPGPTNFYVIHTNGFHPVTVYFCQCEEVHSSGSRVQQLLRRELYPATVADPTTCFSFRMLEHFHMLTLQSKSTAYDYYRTLQYLTDNAGTSGVKFDRLKALFRVVREWRYLKALKRAGRGHEPGGVNATKNGELAVRCPACPRPGFNLPDNWQDVSDDMKYLYTTILAIDANFRLKRRAVSNEERDPALGPGWGYFVENEPYRAHLLDHADEDDMSSCTGFQALAQKNTRFSAGYAATGVGIALDARHGFILPNGVGDLQKGERYCNMDYIVASALKSLGSATPLILSYDIVCQWQVHLAERLTKLPSHLRITLPTGKDLRYAIPKYHFNAHKGKDHNQYSLNLLKAGRTDGEEVERNWSKQNPTAGSTKEMGPGSRQNTLEDHFSYSNWRKLVELISWLPKKWAQSQKDSEEYTDAFIAFREKVPESKAQEWIKEVQAWESDPSLPDPYYRETTGITESELRRQLAEEDDNTAKEGDVSLHQITPASMLVELLEIEDQQRKFRLRYPSSDSNGASPAQLSEITEKRTILRRRIASIRDVQAIYMPCVPQLVARERLQYRTTTTTTKPGATLPSSPATASTSSASPDVPEKERLFLPCHLSSTDLQMCHTGLDALEERLRDAQLHDSLDKLRIQLHVKSRMINFKNRNVCNQGPNTRVRRQIDVNEQKIKVFAEKYRAAWRAKLALAGEGDWQREFRLLNLADVRTMVAEDDPVNREAAGSTSARKQGNGSNKRQMISEGRRKVSWIWLSAAAENEETELSEQAGLSDALKEEFLRTRARAMRYIEELSLLQEEHRRTLVSFEQEALQWDRREGIARRSGDDPISQGVAAYASKQASLRRDLHSKSMKVWSAVTVGDQGKRSRAKTRPAVSSRAAHTIHDDDDEELRIIGELDDDGDI